MPLSMAFLVTGVVEGSICPVVLVITPEAWTASRRGGGRVVRTIDPATDAVIDGVFGTGFRGSFNLPGYLADHNLVIPETAGLIACDIPSGVNSDTGEIPGQALAADLT